MTQFTKYNKIYGFHNVVKNHHQRVKFDSDVPSIFWYMPKIKLHGTNASVVITSDGVYAAKRSGIITPDDDNFGFAQWVEENKSYFEVIYESSCSGNDIVTIRGEWAGPGVQKGVSVSQIPEKSFFVFEIKVEEPYRKVTSKVVHPDIIDVALDKGERPSNVYSIPIHGKFDSESLQVDMSDRNSLNALIEYANREVEKIEECDPYINEVFGIEGVGEGLVFYPVQAIKKNTGEPCPFDSSDYIFKVKGEKHATNKMGKPARVDIVIPDELYEFIDGVVTEARLEQGVQETNATEKGDVGKLIGWICKDVSEECRDELEAFGLPMKKVQGPIAAKVRTWYFNKIEEL